MQAKAMLNKVSLFIILLYSATHYKSYRAKIKVILLDDATTENTNVPAEALDRDADFFSTAGLWKNRDDISQESIRAKAWRNNIHC